MTKNAELVGIWIICRQLYKVWLSLRQANIMFDRIEIIWPALFLSIVFTQWIKWLMYLNKCDQIINIDHFALCHRDI